MAAPANKSVKDLNGQWVLNKKQSDSADPVLALQGIGYLIRKGIGYATVTLNVNQYTAPPKPPHNDSTEIVTHIDIEQSASGLSSTQENRCVDDKLREHTDWLFGTVKGRSRWVKLADVDDEFLKKGWEDDDGEFVLSHVESQGNGWTATQVWGFKLIEGERKYCRNLVVTKGNERVTVQFVYDFKP